MRQLKTVMTCIATILAVAAPAGALPFNDLEQEGRYSPYEFNMDDGGVPQFPVYTVVTNNSKTYCLTGTYEDAGMTDVLIPILLLSRFTVPKAIAPSQYPSRRCDRCRCSVG